jgi:aminoglycoside phosphotransferase (APT) family kinase protein
VTTPLASGREADIFALDDKTRVLRRYRRAADTTGEAAVMAYVGGLGYPVPEVFAASGNEMVLERLDGPTLSQSMEAGRTSLEAGAETLAGLIRRLHELPPWPGDLPHWPGDENGGPGNGGSVLHLDLHPENIMLTSRGPMVIDWCNARIGEADLDTGLSALILAQVAVDGTHPMAAFAGDFLDTLLPLLPGHPVRLLDEVVEFRAGQLTMGADDIVALDEAAAWVRGER